MRALRIRRSDPAAGGAEARAQRALGVAVGAGSVLWLITHRTTIVDQADRIAAWWTPLTVAAVGLAGAAAVAAAVLCDGHRIRFAAAVLAVIVPVSIAALPTAVPYGEFAAAGTWIPPLVGCTVVAGVLAWRRYWPITLLLSGAVAVFADIYITGGGGVHSAAESLLRTWVTEGFFACVAAGILRAATRLDAATAAAVRQAELAATAEATDRERARFAGLIHDNVLATLLDAARSVDECAPRSVDEHAPRRNDRHLPARAAARTLRQLDDNTLDLPGEVAVTTAVLALRRAVADAGGGFTVNTEIAGRAAPLPRDVVAALTGAAAEAARNSLRHAATDSEPVSRTMSVAIDDAGATVRIGDDGTGFDPHRIADDRLGIRHSIVARMRRVAGGDAVVDTQPGHGAAIVLRWFRAAPAASHLPTLLHLRGSSGLVALILLELAIAMLMVGHLTGHADPVAAIAGYGMVGVAAIAVLVPRHDPLPRPATALIMVIGPAAVLATRIDPPSHFVHHASWILVAYSYPLALLVIRGRILGAWLGLAAAAVAFAATESGGLHADGLAAAAAPAGIVAAVTCFAAYLRPTLRTFHQARTEVTRHAEAEARTAAYDRERRRQLAYLDRTARPMLERIASGEALTEHHRTECALLEAQLRDRLRAPSFDTAEMVRVTRAARHRGVTVMLLDDGGLGPVSDTVRHRVVTTATAAVADTADGGRVTVRAMPPDRSLLATVVIESDSPRRIEIGPDGIALATPEYSAPA